MTVANAWLRISAKLALAAGLLAFGLSGFVFAGNFERGGVGTTAAQFLKLSATARGSAMGEAMTAIADDSSALFWNPAGLINVTSRTVVFTHASYLAGSYYDYAAYGQDFGDMGAFGVGVQYMNHGGITQTDASGVDVGNFNPYDIALSLGFASYISGFNKYPEERFVLGVAAKIVSCKITGQDSTISADAGILSPWYLGNRLRLGVAASNIIGGLQFEDDTYRLPFNAKFGMRLRVTKIWDFTTDIAAPIDNYPYFAAGTEMRIPVLEKLRMDLRAGFNTRAMNDYSGFRNISFGMGLAGTLFSFDYSLSPFGEIGDAHRFTLKTSF